MIALNKKIMDVSQQAISSKFPEDKKLIFNETSVGGMYRKRKNYKIQFGGPMVSGTGHFEWNESTKEAFQIKEATIVFETKNNPEKKMIRFSEQEKEMMLFEVSKVCSEKLSEN